MHTHGEQSGLAILAGAELAEAEQTLDPDSSSVLFDEVLQLAQDNLLASDPVRCRVTFLVARSLAGRGHVSEASELLEALIEQAHPRHPDLQRYRQLWNRLHRPGN